MIYPFIYDKVYYTYEEEFIKLFFVNFEKEKELFFDNVFKEIDIYFLKKTDLEELSDLSNSSVLEIKQNEDFDYYILLGNNKLLKLYFFPDDNYDNGVIQRLEIIDKEDLFFKDAYDDFLNFSEKILV